MRKFYTTFFSPNSINLIHSIDIKSAEHPHFIYPSESHTMLELIYIISGSLNITINGMSYKANSGDLIIINATEFHSMESNLDMPYECINLHFPPNLLPVLKNLDVLYPFQNSHLYQHIVTNEFIEQSRIPSILKKMLVSCKKNNKYTELKLLSLIHDFLFELTMLVDVLLENQYHVSSPQQSGDLVSATIAYINDNLTKNISTSDIAEYLGVSESYLYRIFKKTMKVPLHGYINQQKMQQALAWLRNGYTPQDVSERLGYDYYMTFFTQFKKTFKEPPSNFM